MGSYSTIKITKEDIIKEILKRVFDASNSELEDMLFALTQNDLFFNYSIVDSYDQQDDDHDSYSNLKDMF